MSVPLHRILPATVGRAVDARHVAGYLASNPDTDALVLAWANAFYTRFEGRIEGRSQALRIVGAQVAALIALVEPLVHQLRSALPEPAAGMVFADAIASATAARLLAEVDRRHDPDVMALLALLRGLGTAIALTNDADAQLRWWRQVRRAHGEARRAASEELFGSDPACHTGSFILELDGPAELATAIADLSGAEPFPFATEVRGPLRSATALAHALGAVDSGVALMRWVASSGLPESGAWSLVDEVIASSSRLAELLALPCRPWAGREHLLGRSGRVEHIVEPDELQILALLQAELIHHLRAHATRVEAAMTERVRVDPVTDLPSFQAFVESLGSALEADQVRSLIVVELRGFGTSFARMGLRRSDALLAQVAKRLDALFDGPLLARIGPATFLVASTDHGRRARVAADRARQALSSTVGSAADVDPVVTSVDLDEVHDVREPEPLIEWARLCVQQAPSRGRRRTG